MGLLDFAATPEGQGLLSMAFGGLAGARRGAPLNSIGRAGLAGLQGYTNAIDQQSQQQTQADMRKYREMQMAQIQQQQEAQMQRQKGVQEFVNSINPTAAALGNGMGPTVENASSVPDSKTMQYYGLLKNGLIDPVEYIKATGPKDVKIKEYKEVRNPDGSVTIEGLTEDGRVISTNKTPFVKPEIRDFGGSLKGIDQITGKVTSYGNKTMTPDAVASNALGWDNNRIAKQRLAFEQSQSTKPVFNSEVGGFVMAPNDLKPGEVRKVDGITQKLTEDQAKATGWLAQATNAYDNMRGVLEKKPSAAKPGFADAVASIPSFGLGEAAGNMMRGEDRQKFMQSSSSLSESLLRAATGAGVTKDEADQKIRELTPVFGDSDAVIQQKLDAIPMYIESLKVRSGGGAANIPRIMEAKQKNSAMSPGGWSATVVK